MHSSVISKCDIKVVTKEKSSWTRIGIADIRVYCDTHSSEDADSSESATNPYSDNMTLLSQHERLTIDTVSHLYL